MTIAAAVGPLLGMGAGSAGIGAAGAAGGLGAAGGMGAAGAGIGASGIMESLMGMGFTPDMLPGLMEQMGGMMGGGGKKEQPAPPPPRLMGGNPQAVQMAMQMMQQLGSPGYAGGSFNTRTY